MCAKLTSIFFGMLFYTATVQAQITIGAASVVAAKGIIAANASFSNSSTQADFVAAQLFLTGTNQTLTTASPLTFQGLTIGGGGVKTMKGDWSIARDLNFIQGIVSLSAGKMIYTGATMLSGRTASFVDGTLFQRGAGVRFFPIGVGSTYMPMSLNEVEDGGAEIGVAGFVAGANLALPIDISSIASNRYWQVSASNGSLGASSASLYVPGSSIDASQRLVVVEAEDANGATAINLAGGLSGDFVTSLSRVTKPILTIGIGEKVELRIHDLISPYNGDEINDQLHIVNVQFTSENKVTLLDRWGVVVKQWNNFRNYDDPVNPNNDNYDFSRLSPGNYICVLEYQLTPESNREKMSQMITVLKGN